ncbi:MAG TPA: nuclear transport factor 2 family protein [Candidatus Melainabacteria bacterium]|nr:nuclear transport factor 2 family protein [Candidatus Melainabacteria bacterium]
MLKFNWQNNLLLEVSNRRQLFGLTAIFACGLLIAQPAFSGELIAAKKSSVSTKVVNHDADEQIIRAQAVDYAKAFALGDVPALLSMWDDNGVLIDQRGKVSSGRDAISAQMSSFFNSYGKQPLELKIYSLEFPAENLAIERGASHVGTNSNPMSFCTYTAVHVKRNGKWLMVNVSEAPKFDSVAANIPLISDLSWLIGNWNVEGPRGSLQIKADWVAGKKIIRCDFDALTKDGEKSSQTQFIFYDPLFKRIRSWQYDWNGGYGESRWFKNGNDWEAQGCSVQPDGSTGSARYLFKKLDDNTFSWQSTSRRLLGRSLPDTPVLTARRSGS